MGELGVRRQYRERCTFDEEQRLSVQKPKELIQEVNNGVGRTTGRKWLEFDLSLSKDPIR